MIKSLYIDTSVYGGYFDKEFEKETIPFFDNVFKQGIKIFISDLIELEIYRGPDFVISFFESISKELIQKIDMTDEVRNLSLKYISEKVVGKTSVADCQHIAFATIYKADVLVSWNFKHIVNLERIRGYNSVNYREGYRMIEIRTPKEIFSYENENE
jgi:hypothetical protein